MEVKCFYKKGVPEGIFSWYYPNGQLDVKRFYKNGVFEGVCEWYHPNGQLAEKCFYKNGVELTPEEYRKLKMEKLKRVINEIERS